MIGDAMIDQLEIQGLQMAKERQDYFGNYIPIQMYLSELKHFLATLFCQ